MTKQKEWFQTEQYEPLSGVLKMPVVQRAFDVIREIAQSSSAVVAATIVQSRSPEEAMLALSVCQASQAGMLECLSQLEKLGKPKLVRKRVEVEAPYDKLPDSYMRDFNLFNAEPKEPTA